MRFAPLAIVLAACGGTGVREVRNGGASVLEAKCKGTSSECLAGARERCPEGYEVLDSESHAGGIVADAMPGPVTWYVLTFRCAAGVSAGAPTFPTRGATNVAPPAPTFNFQPPPVNQGRCYSDVDCGPGRYCAKGASRVDGVCAER